MGFKLLHTKVLPSAVQPDVLSWCPTMDLIAFVSKENHIWIYRSNGQRVWSFPLKRDDSLVKLCWSPDGKSIAVATQKEGYRMYDVYLGKIITDAKKLNMQTKNQFPESPLQTINWALRSNSAADHLDQYEDVFNVDCIKLLPKLSPLPNASSDHILTSKLAIDSLIQSSSTISDFLILGYENGILNMTLNGLFNISPVQYTNKDNASVQFLQIESTPDLSKHYILSKTNDKATQSYRYSVLPVTIDAFKENGAYVTELITSATKIQLLIIYLQEVVSNLSGDCKNFLEFNHKLVTILEDEASKNDKNYPLGQPDSHHYYATSELYELLLTGMMSDNLKSWLENSVGEKNLKKWLKLGNNCIDQVKFKIFSLLIPAAERLIILVSKLKHLSGWNEDRLSGDLSEEDKISKLLGLNSKELDESIELTKNLLRNVYKFVIGLNHEQKLFNCFINWLTTILDDLKDEDKKNDFYNENYYFSVTEISEYITKRLHTLEVFEYLRPTSTSPLINSRTQSNLSESYNILSTKCLQTFDKVKGCLSKQVNFENLVTFGEEQLSINEKPYENAQCKFMNDGLVVFSMTKDNAIEFYKIKVSPNDKAQHISKLLNFSSILKGKYYLKLIQVLSNDELLLLAVENATLGLNDKMKTKFIIFTIKYSEVFSTIIPTEINPTSEIVTSYYTFNDNENKNSHDISINPRFIAVCNKENTTRAAILDANMQQYMVVEFD